MFVLPRSGLEHLSHCPLYPTVLSQQSASRRTHVVMLGTGTPRPLPHRFGPSTAVVVDDTPYLVDFGPGVVRRAAAAAENGIEGLAVNRLDTAFVTHLHSDHTVGYPDLIFTPWVMGRSRLRVYGPKGIAAMTEHVLAAWKIDIDIRTSGEGARQRVNVETHEIEAGLVYQDANVTVTAFPARHGDVPNAFGYTIKTPDRTIVISGDTSPNPALVAACQRCDILIHEAYASDVAAPMTNWADTARVTTPPRASWRRLRARVSRGSWSCITSPSGRRPGQSRQNSTLREIQATYKGTVVIARDLDVY